MEKINKTQCVHILPFYMHKTKDTINNVSGKSLLLFIYINESVIKIYI